MFRVAFPTSFDERRGGADLHELVHRQLAALASRNGASVFRVS
jgi:hypothetical protein